MSDKMFDTVEPQSYDTGYLEGYRACQLAYKKRAKYRKQLRMQKKRRQLYFLKQKLIGVLILFLTILAVKILDGDATIALITVPLGFILIFTKEKWWMDNYYFEKEYKER